MTPRTLLLAVAVLTLVALTPRTVQADAKVPSCSPMASELYFPCASCHGFKGEGNEAFGAPALAGLPSVYVARQLRLYRAGARGNHRDDTLGQQMSLLAMTLRDDAAIESVACFIGAFPATAPPTRTLAGNIKRGKQLYALCATCHGERGEGLADLEAPPIRQFADWYLRAQLHAYRAGWRASNADDDARAAQMNAAAATLANDREIADLAAYIVTLR